MNLTDLIDSLLNDIFDEPTHNDSVNSKNVITRTTKKTCPHKVIISEPAVILIVDGKKYISKADGEPFDEEKGLLMCLAKANGFPFDKVHKMLENAQRTQKN